MPPLQAEVEEDYAPFNVEVTTSRTTYDRAGGYKIRVNLVASAPATIGSSCGVAFLNTVTWTDNTAWASCSCGEANIGQIISHEVGHVFSLGHDGTTSNRYLFGLPPNFPRSRQWNAIMGGAAASGLTQC